MVPSARSRGRARRGLGRVRCVVMEGTVQRQSVDGMWTDDYTLNLLPLTSEFRWSCRESNPGPTAFPQGFSARSPLCLYLDLPVTRTIRDDDPSRCWCPDVPR